MCSIFYLLVIVQPFLYPIWRLLSIVEFVLFKYSHLDTYTILFTDIPILRPFFFFVHVYVCARACGCAATRVCGFSIFNCFIELYALNLRYVV